MFNIQFFFASFPAIVPYIPVTLGITVFSMISGLILAIFLALATNYKIFLLSALGQAYISFFRGTPLLVQIFVLYYGLPQVFPSFTSMDSITAALIGLSLNTAAYQAESIRGALNSVEQGQMEACLSSGMGRISSLYHVVIPQAARVAVPSIANNFIGLLKETSLVFTIGVTEMLASAKIYSSTTFHFMEGYLAVAIVYWMISLLFGRLQSFIEKKLNTPYRPGALS